MSFLRSTMRSSRPVGPSLPARHVAGVQPALGVDRLARRLVVPEVAAEDDVAADQDLAVVGELHLDAGIRHADRADRRVVARLHRRRAGRLGQAVGLADRHAEHAEEPAGCRARSARPDEIATRQRRRPTKLSSARRIMQYQNAQRARCHRLQRARGDRRRVLERAHRPPVQRAGAGRRPRAAWSGSTRGTSPRSAARRRRSAATSSRRSSCTVRRLSAKLTTAPVATGMWIENICSATWHSGRYDTSESRSLQPQDGVEAACRRAEAAPAHHRRLRPAGRPRREDHQPDVVEVRRRASRAAAARGVLGFEPPAERDDLLEIVQAGAVVAAQAARIDDDDRAQVRQPLANREHLVELLLVLADDDRRLATAPAGTRPPGAGDVG